MADDGGWSPKQVGGIKKLYLDAYCIWKVCLKKKKYNLNARYD